MRLRLPATSEATQLGCCGSNLLRESPPECDFVSCSEPPRRLLPASDELCCSDEVAAPRSKQSNFPDASILPGSSPPTIHCRRRHPKIFGSSRKVSFPWRSPSLPLLRLPCL